MRSKEDIITDRTEDDFASRAAARIRYVLQEGAEEDRTVALVDLLNKSRRKEEISEKLAELSALADLTER